MEISILTRLAISIGAVSNAAGSSIMTYVLASILASLTQAQVNTVVPVTVEITGNHGIVVPFSSDLNSINDNRMLILGLLSSEHIEDLGGPELLRQGLRVKDVYYGTIYKNHGSLLQIEPFDFDESLPSRDKKIDALIRKIVSMLWSLRDIEVLHLKLAAVTKKQFPGSQLRYLGSLAGNKQNVAPNRWEITLGGEPLASVHLTNLFENRTNPAKENEIRIFNERILIVYDFSAVREACGIVDEKQFRARFQSLFEEVDVEPPRKSGQ